MTEKVNFNVLDTIEKVFEESKNSELKKELFVELKTEINLLKNYLQLNENQVVFFANGFILGYEKNKLSSIFSHLGLEEYKIMKYKKDFDVLFDKKMFKKIQIIRGESLFEISKAWMNAIIENKFYQSSENQKDKDFVAVLEEFNSYSEMFDNEEINLYELNIKIERLLEENTDLPFVKTILKWKLDNFETFFFLDTIWDAVSLGDNDFNTSVQSTVNDYYKKYKRDSLTAQNRILDEKTKLHQYQLIELSKEVYKSKTRAKLSKSIIRLLKEQENIVLNFCEGKNQQIIFANKIQRKELFYGKKEQSQIETVSQMLLDEKFISIQQRLKENAMPVGFTIILYGEPGTGKTESIYQLARQTGRNIMKVDISETKSMWFGESQKLAKKVFTDYQEFKKNEEICPILLLNEADGIIGKRKEAGSTNTADTENAIQNVFLEEIENFDGILFATTNLVGNMDKAFERRFLYKIQFQKPDLGQSQQIWKSKLPFLLDNETLDLASSFEFSGGEMENIARKVLTNEILFGEKPNFETIKTLCQNEKWAKNNQRKIGF